MLFRSVQFQLVEISITQQAGTELENKTEETSVLPEIQSTEPED